MNEELGSKRLGLFRFLETETTARGECLRGSTTRGEAGLTVLGDCLRVICFDISFLRSYSSRSYVRVQISLFPVLVLRLFSKRRVKTLNVWGYPLQTSSRKGTAANPQVLLCTYLVIDAGSLQSIWVYCEPQPEEGYKGNAGYALSVTTEPLVYWGSLHTTK